ncbi:MAG: cytochrome b561 family protein [Caulobacter sp.]|nr:cytochrome b561 family protein [Caulobacter sp.]
MRWLDGKADFGWISIILHWTAAAVVVSLLFIGNSIQAADGVARDHTLRLHTTLALGAYALLWARVIWRVAKRHPRPLPRQNKTFYAIGKPFHYLLLAAIVVMLLTGPLMAWSGDLPLRFFNLVIPSPIPADERLFVLARWGHIAAATVLGWGTLVHILAAIKHIAVDKDGAFDKMMTPLERPGDARVD